jgi:hypothetical protein
MRFSHMADTQADGRMQDGGRMQDEGRMQDGGNATRLAAALGHVPEAALAARIGALCRRQIDAARPLLDTVEASDDPAHHVAALTDLARDG